jgi:hypothetical protein
MSHRQRPLALGGGLALLALVVCVGEALFVVGPHSSSDRSILAIMPLGGSPLGGGKEMSLPEAEATLGTPVLRPDTAAASDRTITGLWVRTAGDPEVYIEYASGIIVIVRPARTGQSTWAFAAAQQSDGVPGELTKVAGVDAFVVPQSPEGDLGSVRFETEGSIVAVIGHGDFDVESLKAVAESISASTGEG